MSARREAYRRSDLLLPHAHALEAGLAENLGLHEMAHPIEEVQVSSGGGGSTLPYPPAFPPSSKLKKKLSFPPQNVDDPHLLLHDQTVIRKGKHGLFPLVFNTWL